MTDHGRSSRYSGGAGALANRVQELCESRGGRPGLPVLISLMVSVDVKKNRAQELGESRSGRPGLPVLMVSVDVKQH